MKKDTNSNSYIITKKGKEVGYEKKKVTSIGAVAMATMLAVQGMGLPSSVLAVDQPAVVNSESNTQMSSEKEIVHVNQYRGKQKTKRLRKL